MGCKMLLNSKNGALETIKEVDFSSEKELQSLCENNLKTLLNLEFIATEFSVTNFRLDTVAYDEEANAFVIIEYKNKKNSSVIDQGYSYLSVMLNHKADFVLEYSRKTNKVHNIDDINWEQSKVIFISPHFTNYQMNSINFKDLPIELWKIKKYNNDNMSFEQIKSINATANISEIAPVKTSQNTIQVAQVTKTYTEDEHIAIGLPQIRDIYSTIKEFILTEDEEIVVKNTKLYIGFYKNRRCLVSIKIQKSSLIVWLNTDVDKVDDEKKLVRDVSNIGHQGNGNSEIKISDDSNMGYIQDILRKYLNE